MMECIKCAEATGKVVQAIEANGAVLLIAFTDRTYAVVGIDRGYEGEVDMDLDRPLEDVRDWFGHRMLIDLDVFTEEEIKAWRDDGWEAEQARREAAERAEFERLKAKYEEVP